MSHVAYPRSTDYCWKLVRLLVNVKVRKKKSTFFVIHFITAAALRGVTIQRGRANAAVRSPFPANAAAAIALARNQNPALAAAVAASAASLNPFAHA